MQILAFVVRLIFLQISIQISFLSSGILDLSITDEKIREHKSLTELSWHSSLIWWNQLMQITGLWNNCFYHSHLFTIFHLSLL